MRNRKFGSWKPIPLPRHGWLPMLAVFLGLALLAGTRLAYSQSAVQLNVDVNRNRRPIPSEIYGVGHYGPVQSNPAILADLNVTLNRWGGNHSSRYNWKQNADNRGMDWYFESLPYSSPNPAGESDAFISGTKAAAAEPMLTIPMIGWVARLGANRSPLGSFSISKYGPQTGRDAEWLPDAGNGISAATGKYITGNDPNDANVPADSIFQQEWVNHIVGKFGRSSAGGLKYYILDNEPGLWNSTHRDVHPEGASMDEIRDRMLDYAAKIKAADPEALTVGPEEWGWSGYFWSGYDLAHASKNGWGNFPDRQAHGGADFLPWLLDQFRQHEAKTGQRLLDVFTVHYYPQSGEYGSDTSTAMQLRRNRSTRSLWDPNYVDESWINDKVQLIPRLKQWANTYYPGTKVGITEYNWGAESHINGATTLADVWGIFGREGLDLATYWTCPPPSSPTYKAMKLYRNYDGRKSTFGDLSVAASAPNPDNVSTYAALRSSDGALTVMVINKQLGVSQPITLNVANFNAAGHAEPWQLTAANTIQRLSDVPVTGGRLNATLPAQSITLFVLPAASGTSKTPPAPGLTAAGGDRRITLMWTGITSATSYHVKRASQSGGPYTTLAAGVTGTSYVDTAVTNDTTYYYVVSAANSSGESANSNEASATPQTWLRINSGGERYTSSAGTWLADTYYIDGSATSFGNKAIANTEDDSLYQTVRFGSNFSYQLPATNGAYTLKLHFAECFFTEPGQRIFNVLVNNKPVLTNFDVFAEAGANVALVKSFPVTAANGGVSVSFQAVVQLPMVQAIELVPDGVSGPTEPTTPTAPAAPAGLKATAGDRQVALTWNASSGASGYTVKRATTSGGQYATVATNVTGTSYTDSGLTNGTTYHYVVTAVSAGGESPNSQPASATPAAAGSAPNPTNVLRINSGGGQYTSSAGTWLADTHFTAGSSTASAGAPIANTTDDPLYQTVRFGTGFSYQLPAENGAYTLKLHFAECWMTGAGQRIFNVLVNGKAVLTNFDVFAEAGGANAAVVKSFPVTATSGGIRVDFQAVHQLPMVQAIELVPGGSSGPTEPTTPAPAAPAGLKATAGDRQVALTWNASNGANSYTVKRATTSGGQYATVATNVTGTSYTDSGLTNGTTYYYVVTAVSAGGESANSNETSARPVNPASTLRINSGGGQYTSSAGTWLADTHFTAGSSTASAGAPIANTTDDPLYQTVRFGTGFSYQLPAENGAYTLKLHFAECWMTGAGQRIFNVLVNGKPVLTNFDVFAEAGANAAVVKSFPVTATNGGIRVDFQAVHQLPMVQAIELVPGGSSEPTNPTVPSAPTGLKATAGNRQVALTWNASSGASSYAVKRATTSGGPYATVATNVTGTSYTDAGLTNGTTYYYVVTAVSAGGESANSNEASAIPVRGRGR